ncbi:MAG: FAD-dependent oxidoreductase [Chloroflexota bacterium]
MSTGETIREPARDIPVFRRCDVLVVGGGPAGAAAATAAARLGANTVLVERYGHLGGMSTGGFVLWIDRMSDWDGRQVIGGFADELLDRLPAEARLGPPRELWGAREPATVAHWADREAAFHCIVTWSPTIDPEWLKLAYLDLAQAASVKVLLHAWAVAPILEGETLRGVIFESKAGRQAILAQVVIDASGDGDIFALAGAPFEGDVEAGDIHHTMNVAFRWGGCDFDRYFAFRREHKQEYGEVMARAEAEGIADRPYRSTRNDVAYFMSPRLDGYSCIDVEDLTAVEVESRRLMVRLLEFYRRQMPGFADAWLLDTAPQLGVRHSRRLLGVKRVTRAEWTAGVRHADEIGLCPAPSPRHPTVSVPYGCLVPRRLENLLAAGRNLSCDAPSHAFLREIPVCWVMGQAAGVAAALAVSVHVPVRHVDVRAVQRKLVAQGALLGGRA